MALFMLPLYKRVQFYFLVMLVFFISYMNIPYKEATLSLGLYALITPCCEEN